MTWTRGSSPIWEVRCPILGFETWCDALALSWCLLIVQVYQTYPVSQVAYRCLGIIAGKPLPWQKRQVNRTP